MRSSGINGHPGVKGSRCIWLGERGTIFNVGFSRSSDRTYSILDPRKLDSPIVSANIDTSSGILMPFYDNDTGLLFLAGKGDGNIRYFEMDDEKPYIHYVSDYKSNVVDVRLLVIHLEVTDVTVTLASQEEEAGVVIVEGHQDTGRGVDVGGDDGAVQLAGVQDGVGTVGGTRETNVEDGATLAQPDAAGSLDTRVAVDTTASH